REVVQLITPGTIMESSMLKEEDHNYIASLSYFNDGTFVIVYHELSTGETQLVSVTDGFEQVIHELGNRQIKELVVASTLQESYIQSLKKQLQIVLSYEDEVNFIGEFRHLYDDLKDEKYMHAFSRLLNYIVHTQKRSLHHLRKP